MCFDFGIKKHAIKRIDRLSDNVETMNNVVAKAAGGVMAAFQRGISDVCGALANIPTNYRCVSIGLQI